MPAAPQFETRRRNAKVGPMVLPAAGRQGPPPVWPLEAECPSFWPELWATPQAVAWESLGWVRVVARYALVAAKAETLDKDAMAEARQLEDRLGLTPKALRLLLWTIEDTPVESGAVVSVPDERWRQAASA